MEKLRYLPNYANNAINFCSFYSENFVRHLEFTQLESRSFVGHSFRGEITYLERVTRRLF